MTAGHSGMTVRLLAPVPATPQPAPAAAAAPPPPPPASAAPELAAQQVACVIRRCLAMQSRPAPFLLPEDTAQVVVDFAAASLLELLAIALVGREFHAAARRRFAHELGWLGNWSRGTRSIEFGAAGLPQLLAPQVAQQFVSLPELLLSSPGLLEEAREEPSFRAFAPFGEDEALLHCQDCSTPILKADDIISSNYRIMTGRAYLTSAAHNIAVSEDTHEAHYTTGQYTVRDVSCARCSLKLGITYVGALDNQNHYKVGKFLVGQHLLVRPVCCLLRSRRLPAELPMPLCPRCHRTAARGALQLVHLTTFGLSLSRTRQLYELLLRQSALEAIAEPKEKAARRRIWAAPRALLTWCLPLFRKSPAACSYESLARMGLEPSEMIPRLGADLWQEAVRERFGMLDALQELIRGEHMSSPLAAVVRFISAVVGVARNVAPSGASRPERVPLLLQVLPALVSPGRADALRGARSLALAVRREWLTPLSVAAGGARVEGTLSSADVKAIARGIAAHAAEGILEHLHAAAAAAAAPGGARLEMPVEGLPFGTPAPPSPLLRPRRSLSGMSSPLPGSPSDRRTASSRSDSGAGLGLGDTDEEPMSETTSVNSTDELLLQCMACGNPVLKADDILSSNYRIMTSPAYLVGSAYNVQLSPDIHEAAYASGRYTVRDATCVRCSARLGVMYTGAADAPNQYKVGKFLMGQDQLLLPPSGAALPKDEQALYKQLLDLMNHGSILPVDVTPEAAGRGTATRAGDPTPAAAQVPAAPRGDRDPLVGGLGAAAAPGAPHPARQRLVVTIRRYIRCIFPVVHFVPVANPWANAARRQSPPAGPARHAPRPVPHVAS
uniref:Yippee domain-containing protein n=1 Tax=Alexandrium monilatum TaxID=311494 RepID=A0A7S4WBW1_9DINO